ncbi:unannotated protein [freshwater metagenome]|uniref:Unannotated protein n=1 Tax=freshwater metagenome TaxID=449393 RepID=A0A6J6I8Q4_9ZZZZ
MNSRFFDVLHDATDVQSFSVVKRIDIDFDRIVEKSINKEWCVGTDNRRLGNPFEVITNRLSVVDDFHAASAEYIRRPHEHGEPDIVSNGNGRLNIESDTIAGRNEPTVGKHLREAPAFFGDVNRIWASTQD